MRLHNIGWLLLALSLATALPGCKRLSFIKPNYDKTQYEEDDSRQVDVHDSPQVKQRIAAQERLALASNRLRGGDLDAAEKDAHAVLKDNPKSADANTILAVIESQRGRNAQAGAYYKRAAELAPGQGEEFNNYGAWLCGNGRAAESLAWFDQAIAAPNYRELASALANAGSCAVQVGQLPRAQRDLHRSLELDPGNSVALGAMADLAYRNGNYFEARAFSERRLSAAPANADVLQLASQIETKLGDKAAADRYVQRLRQEFPDAKAANAVDTRSP